MTKILMVDEAAEVLRVSHNKVRRLLQEGSLRGYHEGREWRILEEDLKAYVAWKLEKRQGA